MRRPPPRSTLFPYTTLFRSEGRTRLRGEMADFDEPPLPMFENTWRFTTDLGKGAGTEATVAVVETVRDRKSTRLNSSHSSISYAVFCLKKKKENRVRTPHIT